MYMWGISTRCGGAQETFVFFLAYKCKGYIVIASVHRSVCLSFMLSPPKPFDEIQPNLVCEFLT